MDMSFFQTKKEIFQAKTISKGHNDEHTLKKIID